MKKSWHKPMIDTLDIRLTEDGKQPSQYEGGSFIIVGKEWTFIHETHPES